MTNGMRKSKVHENASAKRLTSWSGVKLVRTLDRTKGTADIWTKEHVPFPFVVECKNQEGWVMDNFFKMTSPIPEWLDQMVKQTEYRSKQLNQFCWPMLIFTRNFWPNYVLIPAAAMPKIACELTCMLGIKYKGIRYLIGELEEFFQNVQYDDVVALWNYQQRIQKLKR